MPGRQPSAASCLEQPSPPSPGGLGGLGEVKFPAVLPVCEPYGWYDARNQPVNWVNFGGGQAVGTENCHPQQQINVSGIQDTQPQLNELGDRMVAGEFTRCGVENCQPLPRPATACLLQVCGVEGALRGGLQSAVTPAVEHPWRPRSTACVLAHRSHWGGWPRCQPGQPLVSSCAQTSVVGGAALAPAHATTSIDTSMLYGTKNNIDITVHCCLQDGFSKSVRSHRVTTSTPLFVWLGIGLSVGSIQTVRIRAFRRRRPDLGPHRGSPASPCRRQSRARAGRRTPAQ